MFLGRGCLLMVRLAGAFDVTETVINYSAHKRFMEAPYDTDFGLSKLRLHHSRCVPLPEDCFPFRRPVPLRSPLGNPFGRAAFGACSSRRPALRIWGLILAKRARHINRWISP